MSAALEISTLDVRQPLIPLEEFYNEPLNETIGTTTHIHPLLVGLFTF